MSPATSPDQMLAKRAAAGHPEAWDELIELYGRKIYNLAYQFAASKEEAEDLTQEIFVKLYENLDKYRGDVPLVAWTLRLSRNLCIDRYRKRRREKRSTFVSEGVLEQLTANDNPRRDAERRQKMRAIYGGLERLPEDLAEVVILADLQGWTLEETATYVDVPLGTVKSRLHRARKRLAAEVEKLVAAAGGIGTPRREVQAC